MMELVPFFLASLVAYCGLISGIILIRFAPEEQKPGEKYFLVLNNLIFVLVIGVFLAYAQISAFLVAGICLAVFLFMEIKKIRIRNHAPVYGWYGIVFALSSKMNALLVLESLLIFVYGMSAGSIEYNQKEKNHLRILRNNALFFVPIILAAALQVLR